MIKTIVTPQNNSLYLAIPNSYVGKEIEILLYSKDELMQEKTSPKKTMADFWGVLSNETANDLHKSSKESRNDWQDRLDKQR